MAAPKVFVSYSRHDRDITQRLVTDLTKAGAEVWVMSMVSSRATSCRLLTRH